MDPRLKEFFTPRYFSGELALDTAALARWKRAGLVSSVRLPNYHGVETSFYCRKDLLAVLDRRLAREEARQRRPRGAGASTDYYPAVYFHRTLGLSQSRISQWHLGKEPLVDAMWPSEEAKAVGKSCLLYRREDVLRHLRKLREAEVRQSRSTAEWMEWMERMFQSYFNPLDGTYDGDNVYSMEAARKRAAASGARADGCRPS